MPKESLTHFMAALPSEAPSGSAGDQVWISVIQKMDEVFSDLLRYEVALEEKNEALEESQRFTHSVLGAMSDIVIVTRLDGSIEEVNDALVELTGRTADALRGSSVFDLFLDEESREAARRQVAQKGAAYDCELRMVAAVGMATVSVNFTPRYAAAGRIVGSVITGRPVGELRRAYQALHEAHEELKRTQQQLLQAEKMASLGRLVAGVAHELNNPISFVLGNVHALKRYAGRLQQYVAAIHANADPVQVRQLRTQLRIDNVVADLESLIAGTIEGAERTRDIVDGLKRFSAPERDRDEPFDLGEVIERSIEWVCKASPSRFRVDADVPRGLIVSGSATQMQQVMMNLIQNAQDATAALPEAHLQVSVERAGGLVSVRFQDNGPGIDPAVLPRVFDPFFTTKPVGKGTGLGLSISYGIVVRHGGHLSVSNAADGGALFVVMLPLVEA